MVNETAYRYLWAMEKAEEEQLYSELAALGGERASHEAAVRDLAERSQEAAKNALRRGMKPSRIARALQYTDGYVRKLRSEAELPPDPRYVGIKPPTRHIGFGEIGVGDTLEEAQANAGPIDHGHDLRALVTATDRQRVAELVDRLRRDDAGWFRSMQNAVATGGREDAAVEILVYALAENRLAKTDFTS
jgi:hypothetical protein